MVRTRSTVIALILPLMVPLRSSASPQEEDAKRIVAVVDGAIDHLSAPNACAVVKPDAEPPMKNLEHSLRYGQIAEMLALIALAPQMSDISGQRRLGSLVEYALVAYERAFDCVPDYEHRNYLVSGSRLISRRLQHLQGNSELVNIYWEQAPLLKERQQQLVAKLPSKPPEQCPQCPQCPAPIPLPAPPPKQFRSPKLALGLGIGAATSAVLGGSLMIAGEARISAATTNHVNRLPEGCTEKYPNEEYRACMVASALDMLSNGGLFVGAAAGISVSALGAHYGVKAPSRWTYQITGGSIAAAAGAAWYITAFLRDPLRDKPPGFLKDDDVTSQRRGYYPSTLLAGFGMGLALSSAAGLVLSRRASPVSERTALRITPLRGGAQLHLDF